MDAAGPCLGDRDQTATAIRPRPSDCKVRPADTFPPTQRPPTAHPTPDLTLPCRGVAGEKGSLLVWELSVYTSDIRGAGTDSNVSIQLCGDKVGVCVFLGQKTPLGQSSSSQPKEPHAGM
jgi:hypothetical protein